MYYNRLSSERGQTRSSSLRTQHSFSFGPYFDLNHLEFSCIRVINDDLIQPKALFDTRGHKNMEIMSYIVDGTLEHTDRSKGIHTLKPGAIQLKSAGTGLAHIERNPSDDQPLRQIQVWIQPFRKGLEPCYQYAHIEQQGMLTPLITPRGTGKTLRINQNASVFRVVLQEGESVELSALTNTGYLHIISGHAYSLRHQLSPGDGLGMSGEHCIITATSTVEALWITHRLP